MKQLKEMTVAQYCAKYKDSSRYIYRLIQNNQQHLLGARGIFLVTKIGNLHVLHVDNERAETYQPLNKKISQKS